MRAIGGAQAADRGRRREHRVATGKIRTQLRWLGAVPLLGMIALLAVLALLTLTNAQSRAGGAREALFDVYARLFPAPAGPANAFQIIEIDRESLEKIGPWPWPRSLSAELVTAAGAAGAKGVVFLEGVDTPDPLSPETIGEFWLAGARNAELGRQLSLLPSTDVMLARAFSGSPGAIALGPEAAPRTAALVPAARADLSKAAWLSAQGSGQYMGLPTARPRFAIDTDLVAAARVTVSSLPADADGVVRHAPLLWSVSGSASPLAAVEAARMAAGAEKISIIADASAVTTLGATPKALRIGAKLFPLGPDAATRIYPPRQISIQKTPAWRVIEDPSSLSQIKGRVAIIGLSDDVGPSVRTARGEASLAEAHALIARQLLAGAAAARPAWIGYLEAGLVMLLGAAAIMWSQRLAFWSAIAAAAAASLALFGASIGAFAGAGLLFDPLAPMLALFLGALSTAGGRSIGEALADDSVRGAFKGSLPESTMKKVREDGGADALDAVWRPLTVLSCELRMLDEDLKRFEHDPAEVANLMAAGCAHLKKAMIDAGGAADQADGGRVIAYFNAPLENVDHSRAACSAALRLVESMDKINAEIEQGARTRGVQLHLAIGVATGDCFAGPMGHGRANRYSAIGEATAVAAFLSRQASVYGPAIIVDETVHRRTNHHFAFLELDRVRPRGEERAFSIFALVGNPFIKSSKSYRALEEAHRALLAAYREGDFQEARAQLTKAKQSPGAKIALFDIYESRIARMSEIGAPAGWDGAEQVTI
jgi:adenylate cyclase